MRHATVVAALCAFGALGAHARTADAFCGFYVAGGDAKLFNEATQVVLMREGNKTALSMQNNYQGPAEDFAMVIPVPQVLQKENVKTLPKEVFDTIDTLSAPRLVEYWEQDPCAPMVEYEELAKPSSAMMDDSAEEEGAGGVKIEAQFEVGEYQVVVLSATESTALDTYLKQENYRIPDGAEPYFRPYIEGGMYFFVAKVDAQKVKYQDGRAVLSPLRFDYESDTFQLPIRLGMINSQGKQDLLTYILARGQRYQVANYENTFIPTNIEVRDAVRKDFPGFYTDLFDATLEKFGKTAVVTEYSWDASTCDPCPGPMLSEDDYMTLGADVLGAPTYGWVLTRLHARYDKSDIGEDLVFEAAPPVLGGNEHRNSDGSLKKGASPGGANMFQGRYVIRHEWTGAVDCDDPQYGTWGGPNGAESPTTGAAPSPNTRGKAPAFEGEAEELELAALVKEPVPEAGIVPSQTDDPAPRPGESDDKPTSEGKEPKSTCAGCASTDADGSLLALFLGMLLIGIRRRH